MVRVAMLMCEHHHKRVYNTTSASLYPVARLSGAATCSPQRTAPRLETSEVQLTDCASAVLYNCLYDYCMVGPNELCNAIVVCMSVISNTYEACTMCCRQLKVALL